MDFVGAIVRLKDALGNILASVATDSQGRYSFVAAASSYIISVEKPSGYEFTQADQGSDDNVDSDVDIFGDSDLFNLLANEWVNRDAGLLASP